MKREALAHPKTLDLAARLNCSRAEAIGLLTLLWNWTADYAIAGDVGRWPNAVIAKACDFCGDPETFISALVDARWLDQDEQHRLVIHDWSQHCENWIRAKAKNAGIELLGGLKSSLKSGLKSPLKSGTQERDLSPAHKTPTTHACANQTKPNQSQPSQTHPRGGGNSLKLEEADLRSIDRLAGWIDSGSPGVNPPLERQNLSVVLACANEALSKGDNPLALFRFKCMEFVRNRTIPVPDDAYDAAKRAVRLWREPQPEFGQFAEATTELAGCLADSS